MAIDYKMLCESTWTVCWDAASMSFQLIPNKWTDLYPPWSFQSSQHPLEGFSWGTTVIQTDTESIENIVPS